MVYSPDTATSWWWDTVLVMVLRSLAASTPGITLKSTFNREINEAIYFLNILYISLDICFAYFMHGFMVLPWL